MLGMGRRALEPGESGKVTVRGLHPKLGRWRSEASLRAERVRPKRWRGEVRYHDPEMHKVRVITAEGDTKGEAERNAVAALEQERESEGLRAGGGSLTVGRAVRGYIRMMEDGDLDLALSTVRARRSLCMKHLLSDACLIRDVPLKHLTALQIERDMERMVRGGAASQVRTYRDVLSFVLRRAVKARAIKTSPLRDVEAPVSKREAPVYKNGHGRTLNRALTPEEDERLLKHLEANPSPMADLAAVIRFMGLRISEAASLRVQDVDLDAEVVHVRGKVVRVRGEGLVWDETLKSDLSYRTLPIREGARRPLERRRTAAIDLGASEYLFGPSNGSRPDSPYCGRRLRIMFDGLGLKDVTPHTLRRTVERELEMAGATVSERETFMGHTEKVARAHYADHGAIRPSVITALDRSGLEVDRTIPG